MGPVAVAPMKPSSSVARERPAGTGTRAPHAARECMTPRSGPVPANVAAQSSSSRRRGRVQSVGELAVPLAGPDRRH